MSRSTREAAWLQRSIARTARLDAVLALPCPAHQALPGEPCWTVATQTGATRCACSQRIHDATQCDAA